MYLGNLPEVMRLNEGLLDSFKGIKNLWNNSKINSKAKDEAASCAYKDFLYMVRTHSMKDPSSVCSFLIQKIKKYKTDLDPEGLKIYINVFKQVYIKQLKEFMGFYSTVGDDIIKDRGFHLAYSDRHLPSWYNQSLK